MRKRYVAALAVAIAAGSLYGLAPPHPAHAAGPQGAPVSFKEDVLPIFQVHCAACHTPGGEGTKASGLDLTSYQGVMKGTKYGPMVVAGDPENSNLMWLLDWRASPQLRMPHGKQQLPVGERDTIRTWIRQGAKDN
jgi:mono/diheme cytochrome c family protein